MTTMDSLTTSQEEKDFINAPIQMSNYQKAKNNRQQLLRNEEAGKAVEITFEEVSAAAYRIRSGVNRTPCTKSTRLSDMLDMEVFFKREYMQATGSFKERGARNMLLRLTKEQKVLGVVAASIGNHSLALAYHGKELHIPVTVCMPMSAPIMKVQQCRSYEATVHLVGDDMCEAKDFAMQIAAKEKLKYINGYDHPDILAGQGTCGLEIVEQVDDIDAVVIPIGGGGLIAGSAVALKTLHPRIQIIGIESEKCASFKAAFDADAPVTISTDQAITLADGLCVPKVGANAFLTAKPLVDKLIQVSESFIAMAVLRLVEEEKCVVEGAGATGLAAAFAGLLPELQGKRVVFPLCGGNIDSTVLGRVIERGLAADGRLLRFSVVIPDRPNGVSDLTSLLADLGVSVKDIFHERAWLKTSVYSVENKVVCEVRDYEHGCELRKALESRYEQVTWSAFAVEDLQRK